MRNRLTIVTFATLLAAAANAKTTIEIVDAGAGTFSVIHEWTDKKAGNTSETLVPVYFGEIVEVVEVVDVERDQELRWEQNRKEDAEYLIRFFYTNPIPQGGRITIRVKARMKSTQVASVAASGKTSILSIDAGARRNGDLVILPFGYAVVHCSHPVLVYEKKGKTVVAYAHGSEGQFTIKAKKLGN